MQSRHYQEVHIDKIVAAIENYRTVLAQLPTGGGKTVEFGQIIRKFLRRKVDIERGPTLILVHREELLQQAAKAIREILEFEPCLITSDTDRFWVSRCYIGMVTSTMNRLHMIEKPSLIIVDEAHLQDFIKVHRQFPTTKFLAFTATPLSASKKEPLRKYYQHIVCGPQIKELINGGFLSQNITRAPKTSIDPSQFSFDSWKNDYNEQQMASVYRMTANITNCVDKYCDFLWGKKTLVFNVNIQHSKDVTKAFQTYGVKAKHLDSNSPDRAEIFKWFKETPDAVLCSVMIPTMGFDEPTVEAVMLNFSTTSLVKFIQTCGRGSRIIDDYFIDKFQVDYPYQLKHKNYFDIIDLGQNWKRFGDWNDERDWNYIFKYPDEPVNGIAPVKSCPQCEALVHAATRECPHCGWIFERKKHQQMEMEELMIITKGIDIDALVQKGSKKYEYYPMYEMAVEIVNNMFYIHGMNPSQMIVERFFRAYYEKCIEWYRKMTKTEEMIDDITDSGWHLKKARNNFNSLIQKRNKLAYTIKEEIPYKLLKQQTDDKWESFKKLNFYVNLGNPISNEDQPLQKRV